LSIDLVFTLTFGAYGFSVSTPIYEMNLLTNEDFYGMALDYQDPDAIVFIRNNFQADIKEILIPGDNDVFLELYTNVEFMGAEFDDLAVTDYQNQFGENMPYTSGYEMIGEHTKLYSQDYGEEVEYVDEDSSTNQITVKYSSGPFISISGKVTFSDSITVKTYLTVDRAMEPKFEYGRPDIYGAYLQVQPYIVIAYTAPEPPPDPEPDPVPEPPPEPVPEPKPEPIIPKPRPPIMRFFTVPDQPLIINLTKRD
ncbi:MAG: hypothetical protein ACTSSH_11770, partial [Candidatus Heimdallarchaeota archaeon]